MLRSLGGIGSLAFILQTKLCDEKGLLEQRLHIGGRVDFFSASHFFDLNVIAQSATVLIHRNGKDSRGIFGTTIHELAHVSHWDSGYGDILWVVNKRIPESWAVGVEWQITNDIYQGYGIYNNKYQLVDISEIDDLKGYTPLVIDLIDDYNQGKFNSLRPNDQAWGYTLSEIERALPTSSGNWWAWRDDLKKMFDNPTEENIDYLFTTYK
ncbi:hypothetical protein [Maribellus sediminis]|uniref:hypothetical protein n=1 Tax=Maribellus sediminis TaxID=2696285 RepID=UPI00142FE644|nr:hypothetical protein [Maribellus sediminis]